MKASKELALKSVLKELSEERKAILTCIEDFESDLEEKDSEILTIKSLLQG